MGKAGCAVPNCQPNKDDARHRFPNPKNNSIFLLWLEVLNNAALKDLEHSTIYQNARVCDKHFVNEDFSTNNRLRKNAVPQLYLPSRNNNISALSEKAQTTLGYDLLQGDHIYAITEVVIETTKMDTQISFNDDLLQLIHHDHSYYNPDTVTEIESIILW